jgi:hypothetical protein
MATTGKLSNNTKAALNSSAEPRAQNFEDLVLRHIRYSIARQHSAMRSGLVQGGFAGGPGPDCRADDCRPECLRSGRRQA